MFGGKYMFGSIKWYIYVWWKVSLITETNTAKKIRRTWVKVHRPEWKHPKDACTKSWVSSRTQQQRKSAQHTESWH